MASGHLTIDPHTQGQPPGCLPLGPRLTPASPLARLRPAGHAAEAFLLNLKLIDIETL